MSEIISFKEAREKREKLSKSTSQSKRNTLSDRLGQKPTEAELEQLNKELSEAFERASEEQDIPKEQMEAVIAVHNVMMKCRIEPFPVDSELARDASEIVALLASDGLITTKLPDETFANVWMVTESGLHWMEAVQDDFLGTRH